MDSFRDYTLKNHQKTAIILFCVLVSFVAGQIINNAISQSFAPGLLKEIDTLTPADKGEISILKILQAISAIFSFVVPSLLAAKIVGKQCFSYLKVNTSPKLWFYLLIPVFLLAIMPLMNIIIQLNESVVFPERFAAFEQQMRSMEESSKDMINLMISGTSGFDLVINILLVGLLPAIGEEFLFRGVIQKHLGDYFKSPHLAIFISAFIFSAIHFQFYGFIPRLLLGMIFGYMVYFSGSLWPAIFAHFTNNTLAVIATFYINSGKLSDEANTLGTKPAHFVFVISGIVVAITLVILILKKKKSLSA